MNTPGPYRQQVTAQGDQTRRHRPDYWLVIIALFLTVIGLTVVYAISPALSATKGGSGSHYVSRQVIAIVLSIVAFLITARIPLRTWRRWQLPLLGLAAFGTLVALVTPVNADYPAHRWIRLGGLSLQSVEILKFAIIIALAGFLANRAVTGELGNVQKTLKPLGYALLLTTVIVAGPDKLHGQSDLGSFAVILAMVGAMAVVIGLPMRRILMAVAVLGLLVVFVISISPYRRERLTTFMHPESSCLTTGYQACQALIAVGSGGINGLGLGRSVQAYGYLPEAQNDSIFAIYAEKFGFIGGMVLLGLFVATRVARPITALAATATQITDGALDQRVAVVRRDEIGLLPLKGITLPFVSYGGTSVLFVGAALGLVFQISHYTSFSARNVKRTNKGQRNMDASRTPPPASGNRGGTIRPFSSSVYEKGPA